MAIDYSTRPSQSAGGEPSLPGAVDATPAPVSRLRGRLARAGLGLMALAGVLLFARLGFWQLGRAHEKQARAELMQARAALPPLDPAALATNAEQAPTQWQRRITLGGTFSPRATLFLANRNMDGRSGFEVFTPLQLAPGQGILVQRGFAPRDAADPAKLPPLHTASGPVSLSGHLAPWPERWVALGAEGEGPIRQNLDLDALQRASGLVLRPLILVEDEARPPQEDGLSRHWPAPALNVERNQGYALQWFAMSGALALLSLWFLVLSPRLRARR